VKLTVKSAFSNVKLHNQVVSVQLKVRFIEIVAKSVSLLPFVVASLFYGMTEFYYLSMTNDRRKPYLNTPQAKIYFDSDILYLICHSEIINLE